MQQKLKLYEIDSGGATYWVASRTNDPQKIQELIKKDQDVFEHLWGGSIPASCIYELSEREAQVKETNGINIWKKFCDAEEEKLISWEQWSFNY